MVVDAKNCLTKCEGTYADVSHYQKSTSIEDFKELSVLLDSYENLRKGPVEIIQTRIPYDIPGNDIFIFQLK